MLPSFAPRAPARKALVGNTGFRRYLKIEGHGHFAIGPGKAEADARFDGLFLLRTTGVRRPLRAIATTSLAISS